ncbi:hypothetical protein PVK64_02120 [Aliivibrio sp. S4TY2]|uniref:hypothetical protein n=1 Tax=unclassified Aliivibrio TaxID=2645654 RepID=UPI002378B1C2|nr:MULTISPECIES: hypothetical protein [unclassified Aliivibrio]MDD9154989.1 hypothetical protein [Aliivibrio sp. S4TY2]MDD9158648.1 hypothetical protein [Aliivibrio sp. S4TY1]MDD9162992.1 hypothetical protein [Aliivibrio sp. S4MY2]MDD9166647.1 hypothetical protein [Aliivibrio sp. S4MY4]MDD9184069.1 hypothetical protein [Aliivibrio sp. S4MY3]
MNKNALFIGALLMTSAATFHWIMQDSTAQTMVGEHSSVKTHQKIKAASARQLKKEVVQTKTDLISLQEQDEVQKALPQELSRQFALLSKAYAEEMIYPSYSTPLLSNDKSYLEPNHFSEVKIPVLDGSHKASLSLDKYRFSYPEPITVTLNSDLAVDHIEYELLDPETRKSLTTQYTQELTTEFSPQKEWPQEIRIKAVISFVDGKDTLTTDIQFSNPVAYVNSIEPPYSAGSDMILPLNIEVKESGNYRIRANLFQQNGKPIASLNNKEKLSQGDAVFELKAHSSVLKNDVTEFELRNITVEKMSDFPEEKTRYGTSRKTVFTISSFDISSLSDEPYQMSEQEKERLRFLNDIAQQ